jgi:predicted nuclease of predicted toxin-antitoxin system
LDWERAEDIAVWEHAKTNGFTVVTQDSEFFDLSSLRGHPPKVLWLRCGNQRTAFIERLLRNHYSQIQAFEKDATAGCLEIY